MNEVRADDGEMIHFACVYCGRKIWAKDRLAHTQVKCPACGHRIRVAGATHASPLPETHDPPDAEPNKALDWQGMSDREIARELRKRRPLTEQEQKRQATRRALSPFMPHYDSLTLFALSSTFLVLLQLGPNVSPSRYILGSGVPIPSTSGQGPSEPLARVVWSVAEHFAILVPLAGIGMVLSLLGVFYPKPKPEMAKWLMLCFAVVVTGGTGIYAGYIWLTTTRGWLVVFPAWNILNAAIPLLLFRAGLLDTELVLDTAARLSQVVVTLIVTTALLALCLYVFKLHWAVTYSICVGYTMSLNHAITDVFGRGQVATEVEQ